MWRVTVRGKFQGLDAAARAAVLAAGGTAYTDAGTFTHDATVSVFTFRCQVPAGPDDEDDEDAAALRALAALEAYGCPYEVLKIAVTDLRTIRVRRKGRAGSALERAGAPTTPGSPPKISARSSLMSRGH
ncbi:DUF6204 family protein [Nonomuraea sp. MCN248]|uniref:DUF6204 family protein n=1 Tax=Nonomuraea corallina TaxID=2989783 RepID=A0ABT4S424_9ACTN|nr:DUF6204 family protein [Nonomuraea corallina]MDA0631958.1 DUF6204 family protein [Nonomuraea corallina]